MVRVKKLVELDATQFVVWQEQLLGGAGLGVTVGVPRTGGLGVGVIV